MTSTTDRLLRSARLRLSAHINVQHDGERVVMLDTGWQEIRFVSPHDLRVGQFLDAVHDDANVLQLALRLGWSESATQAVATDLYRFGIVRDVGQSPVPAALFCDHIVNMGRSLRTRMAAEVQLLDLPSGGPTRRMLIGSLVETYHFVAAAPFHLAAALHGAPNDDARRLLGSLFTDEQSHGGWLRKGLLDAGLTTEQMDIAVPLPETLAVINLLRVLPSVDYLGYLACVAINESPRADKQIKKDWLQIGAMGLVPPEAVKPFMGHELEDQGSGHAEIPKTIFATHGSLSATQQRQIDRTIRTFLATQDVCYRAMKRFYGPPEGPATFHLTDPS